MPQPPYPDPPVAPPSGLRVAAGPLPAPLLPAIDMAEMPLLGLTVLAVEDSRFASEALRLMCRRAGARLKRAESLALARVHLRTYRADVALVDLGLPDGRGEGLIREMVLSPRRPGVILGMSGDEGGRGLALAAGADGFLAKPLGDLAGFCQALRRHLPEGTMSGPVLADAPFAPDPLALQDDLARAARLLPAAASPEKLRFVAQFLRGIACHAGDTALAAACDRWQDPGGADRLAELVNARLTPGCAFAEG